MSITLALICSILFLFLFAATVSSILYWYETLNTPCKEIPSPKPGLFSCAYLYFQSIMGYATAIALYPIGFFWQKKPSPLNPDSDGEKSPVILIHGLNDNASSLLFLYHRLKKHGYQPFTFAYFSLFVPLEKTLARFDDFVHMVEASFPGKKPLLVGHSLGGLIIRQWLAQGENSSRPLGVATIASPHGGSKMAVFAPGRLSRLLLPGSAFISELKEQEQPASLPCVSLVSPIDEAVLPAASLLPPEGWKMRVTNRASHHSMLFCRYVFKSLLEELGDIEESARSIPPPESVPEEVAVQQEGPDHGRDAHLFEASNPEKTAGK